MAKIKVGVIGTNVIVDHFMKCIDMVQGYEVVIACAATNASIEKFAKKYDISFKTTNYRDLAKDRLVDMVYIATPNHLHYEMTMFFLENRISVFCEKPLAANPKQVSEMIEASQKYNTLLFDGIIPLYTDNFSRLDDYFKMISPLRRAVFTMNHYSSRYDAFLRGEDPPTFRLDFCNGSLMDMGVYCVAVAVGLFGKPEVIQARSSKLPNGTDCLGSAIFSYKNFEVIIMHSKVSNSNILSEVQGENGIILIDSINRINNIYFQHGQEEIKQLGDTSQERFIYQLREFRKAFKAGKIEPDRVPHQLSKDIADVMFEIRLQSGIRFPCYGE